jgi:uncharacterized Zn finger protein
MKEYEVSVEFHGRYVATVRATGRSEAEDLAEEEAWDALAAPQTFEFSISAADANFVGEYDEDGNELDDDDDDTEEDVEE